jgi:hypothetical protein
MHNLRRILLGNLIAAATWAGGTTAATVHIDYSKDTNHFFNVGTPARAAMDAAAGFYSGILQDTLAAIQTPPDFPGAHGTATWNWRRLYVNPSTGFQSPELTDLNPTIAANDILVFVGARNLPTGTLGIGGPGGYDQAGLISTTGTFSSQENTQITNTTNQFLSALQSRGEASGFAAWGGSLVVDIDANWHLNHTTAPAAGEYDLYSVVLHELGHALGFGNIAPAGQAPTVWQTKLSGFTFVGSTATAEYGAPVPLNDSKNHWQNGITSQVFGAAANQEMLMDPSLNTGTRKLLTRVDAAALIDLGWEIDVPTPVGVPGDYNGNGIVDAADYTVWRDTLGSMTDLRANGNNTGASANKIDQADYAFWKSHFGQHAGGGAGAMNTFGVPEPTWAMLIAAAGFVAIGFRSKRRS